MSRRDALIALLALSGFAVTGGCGGRGLAGSLDALVLPSEALTAVAKAYAAQLGEPDLAKLAEDVLGAPLKGPPTEQQVAVFKAGLTRRIRADFAAGDMMRLGGWDISHTEARLWTWLHLERS